MLALLSLGFLGVIGVVAGFAFIIHHFGQDLPDHAQLKNYEPVSYTHLTLPTKA